MPFLSSVGLDFWRCLLPCKLTCACFLHHLRFHLLTLIPFSLKMYCLRVPLPPGEGVRWAEFTEVGRVVETPHITVGKMWKARSETGTVALKVPSLVTYSYQQASPSERFLCLTIMMGRRESAFWACDWGVHWIQTIPGPFGFCYGNLRYKFSIGWGNPIAGSPLCNKTQGLHFWCSSRPLSAEPPPFGRRSLWAFSYPSMLSFIPHIALFLIVGFSMVWSWVISLPCL